MSAYASTFEHDPAWDESLKRPFVRSAVLHAAIVGGFTAYALWMPKVESIGGVNAGGTVIGVEVVDKIPLVSRGETNPVANDTKSVTPPAPPEKQAPKAQPEPPPKNAIAIEKTKAKAKQLPPPATEPTLRPFQDVAPNQVTSKTLPAMSNDMYNVNGSGQIGVGQNTTLGTRFPAYATQIRQLVQQNWRTGDVDPSVKTSPRVTVRFELMRNGSVRNFQLLQTSRIPTLDFSIRRAIETCNFPALPPEYERASIDVEFQFELRR